MLRYIKYEIRHAPFTVFTEKGACPFSSACHFISVISALFLIYIPPESDIRGCEVDQIDSRREQQRNPERPPPSAAV